mgnify:CR=1 FL=1|tara:strand:+ start:727 stop:909 length:183 start_codon:yes stop_codon:yes gene_type:complete
MARKHSKHGGYQDLPREEEAPAEAPACWLCGRPTGETIAWHHPVPMHLICQQTIITPFHQ